MKSSKNLIITIKKCIQLRVPNGVESVAALERTKQGEKERKNEGEIERLNERKEGERRKEGGKSDAHSF